MSKELIERLREAAASRVASTAMIGADDLSVAADVLEQTEAARMAAISRLCEAEVARATACQERDALAAELKALREQEPVAWVNPSYAEPAQGCTYSREDHERWPHIYSQPLYARPVPARYITNEAIEEMSEDFLSTDGDEAPLVVGYVEFARAIERYLNGEGE